MCSYLRGNSDDSPILSATKAIKTAAALFSMLSLETAIRALAYPIYLRTVKREREKIAPEILRLTDELMK